MQFRINLYETKSILTGFFFVWNKFPHFFRISRKLQNLLPHFFAVDILLNNVNIFNSYYFLIN